MRPGLQRCARALRRAAAIGFCLLAAGCSRDLGASDRCAEVAREAYPGPLEITKKTARDTEGVAVAEVEGVAPDSPLGDIAAECRFERQVLTQFRWVTGLNLRGNLGGGSGSSEPPQPR